MLKMVLTYILIASFLKLFFCRQQKLLLVSLDGFRWDYPRKTKTPNIDWIMKNGVTVERVRNVFPTMTLPNHQSLVTGLYPEHHGLVSNSFYDPNYKEIFSLDRNFESKWWNDSVPIWIENQLQGHLSGNLYWPGYNVKIKGMKAEYLPERGYGKPFADDDLPYMPFKKRVKIVGNWLKKDNVTFVALYLNEPDGCSHADGPDHKTLNKHLKKIKECIRNVDKFIGDVKKMLVSQKLDNQVNVIFTGDHGHVTLKDSRVIWLDNYFNTKRYAKFIGGYTQAFIYPKRGFKYYIYKRLKAKENHFKVYLKEDIPEKFHIRNSSRTADILVIGELGWVIANKMSMPWFLLNGEKTFVVGDHGFSNFEPKMNPGFFAYGPKFKKGFKKKLIEIVDIYSLMCHILNIKPMVNDGKFEKVKDLLKDEFKVLDVLRRSNS